MGLATTEIGLQPDHAGPVRLAAADPPKGLVQQRLQAARGVCRGEERARVAVGVRGAVRVAPMAATRPEWASDCPSLRTDATFLPILAAQRTDAATLAADAQARGWEQEATRHQALVARIDQLMTRSDTA